MCDGKRLEIEMIRYDVIGGILVLNLTSKEIERKGCNEVMRLLNYLHCILLLTDYE